MTIDRWRYPSLDAAPPLAPDGGARLAVGRNAWLPWVGVFMPILFAAVAYVALRPPSVDLAAQLFRTELFASHGFLAWNNYWYGGHYLLGYSLVFPPLAATIGATATGGIAALAATGLFGLLARRHHGSRARLATLWFGAGMISMLLSGRLTFALGVAIGLAALLALDRRRPALALPLATASSLASPVAGFFLILVGATLLLAGERRRGAALALAAAAPIGAMALAFPTGGPEPFVFSSVAGTLAISLLVLVALPERERLLRIGVAVYAAVTVALFAVPNPLGGNVARLSNVAAGALLALGLTGPRRRLLLLLMALPLLYWQWQGAVRDVTRASSDPSVRRDFYTPLLATLERHTAGDPVRIEIPPTLDRWEVYYMTPQFLLARGWMRQLESDERQLFRSALTPASYRTWLQANGVSYVALPQAPLDYLSRREGTLVHGGLPYLKPIWSNADWRLFAVRHAQGLIDRPARLSAVGADWFELRTPRAGSFTLRIHFSSYWTVAGPPGACLRRWGHWTRVEMPRPGAVQVGTDLSADALLGRQRVCAEDE